ncbi:MAG: endo-1,4-beta-xylanase [Planctomycetaceae bacterium]|nr:endo-1,4-beta-xylanase [Planctomycetaceae bacterium]
MRWWARWATLEAVAEWRQNPDFSRRSDGGYPSIGAMCVLTGLKSLSLVLVATALASAAELQVPTGQRYKDLSPVDGSAPLLIGAAINSGGLGTPAESIFQREFEFLIPGNEFKQTAVHPEPGVWRWKKSDAFVEYCERRGYLMRLHAPLSPQCSAWAEEDHRTAEELLQNAEEYITAVCQRYNGKPHIKWMDIVNETVTDKGEWFGPKPGVGKWQNPWTQIGFDETHPLRPPLYIRRAFELANEHAPDIKLLINQHAGMETEMWEKVQGTVLYLRERGLRVDGIGWQAHVDTGWEQDPENMRRLNALITWAHGHDLEFHVTENTVWMRKENVNNADGQAATFAAIVRTLIEHSDEGVVVWNAWQLRDGDTQRAELQGTMFLDDGSPKPSYHAVQNELSRLTRNRN